MSHKLLLIIIKLLQSFTRDKKSHEQHCQR